MATILAGAGSSTMQTGSTTKYPHTITSGTGEELTFLRVVRDGNESRVDVENRIQPAAGPPMHVHYLQEESLTVSSGTMGYQVLGEAVRFAGPSESVKFAAGIAHRFWNAGETELRCVGYTKPANNFEYILTAVFDSMKKNGSGRPGLFDTAFLLTKYRSELGMIEIPRLVQTLLFPILLAIGNTLGRFSKFSNAPEAVRK